MRQKSKTFLYWRMKMLLFQNVLFDHEDYDDDDDDDDDGHDSVL